MTTSGDSVDYSGGCMCGEVSYSFREPPLTCGHCHCESCRRWQSAAFGSWTSFAKATFSLTGGPQIYESSPGSYRQFCGKCGSPLFMTSNDEPEVVYATLASLRQSSDLKPTRHVSFEERDAWDPTSDLLPKFE